MRPIEKGNCPLDNKGKNIIFSSYGNAKPYLIDRIDSYCSFCERQSHSAALEVEHILPKSLLQYTHLEKDWNNFLLACKNCNTIKSNNVFNEIYFPDKNNTFLAFQILEGGLVKVNTNLNDNQRNKATNLMNLVGLDRRPGHVKFSIKDDRWLERKKIWELAQKYKQKKLNGSMDDETIIDFAKISGFWSVWFTVFADDTSIKNLLIQEFKGTAINGFQNTIPVNRNLNEL